MHPAYDKIKQAFDENPLAVVVTSGLVITAVAKLIEAVGSWKSKKAYAKQINRRVK